MGGFAQQAPGFVNGSTKDEAELLSATGTLDPIFEAFDPLVPTVFDP
jgi:hypothetical protein